MLSPYKVCFACMCVGLILSAVIEARETPLLTLHHPMPPGFQGIAIHTVKISPDGTKLLAGGNGVKLWDLNTGQELLFITDFNNYVQSAAFSWDSQYIVAGDWLRNIKIFDSQNGKLIKEFQDPETTDPTGDFVYGVAFSPDGKWVLSSQISRTILWDVATGQMIRRIIDIPNLGNYNLSFLPDGVRAVMVSGGAVTVFSVITGSVLQSFDLGGGVVTPDFQRVITAQGGLKVWDLNTGKSLYSSTILEDINLPAVFPEAQGYKIAFKKEDGNIYVDQITLNATLSKSSIKTFAKVDDKRWYRLLFSPDGQKIILFNEDTVYVYDSSVLTSAAPGAEWYK